MITGRQAPADQATDICDLVRGRDPFKNQEVLMSSLNYITLLECNKGPWKVVDVDNIGSRVRKIHRVAT